jgi:hypothetical protein
MMNGLVLPVGNNAFIRRETGAPIWREEWEGRKSIRENDGSIPYLPALFPSVLAGGKNVGCGFDIN